ncbi:MAG TPA: DUF2007 domain-containing protein [Verrucomicrobiae bacterium]|jgi:hypothetical protein
MEFVTVANAATPAEADLVKSRLEANGFLVNVKSGTTAISFGFNLPIGGSEVQVPDDQAESARVLLQSNDSPAA